MLTEDQIDYLFQIRDSKPPLSADTVRVMLKALRWTSDEIERGINFLQRPDAKPELEQVLATVPVPKVVETPKPKPIAPAKIKQNPFPIGSPFVTNLKLQQEKRHKRLVIAGAVTGLIVFIVGIFVYAKFAL